jgi:type VI secretion system protein ImpA
MRRFSIPEPQKILDVDALLAPIAGLSRTGEDLRWDPLYRAIAEAGRDENPQLSQGVWTRDIKRADWPEVERLCVGALRRRSKDLLIVGRLSEAITHRYGFDGMATGLRLSQLLCDHFWPDLYPAIEDGDLAPRLAPFEWMNNRFPTLLRSLPLVRAEDNVHEAYTWTDYANAQLLESLRQRDPKSVDRSEAAGAVTIAAFATVRDRTDISFWQHNVAALQAGRSALADLNAVLGAHCGREAPGLTAIGGAITDILTLTGLWLAERRPKPLLAARRENPPAAAPAARQDESSIVSRQDAYTRLGVIADFLQRTEPHSPVPYLLRCAVSWGDLTFTQLVTLFSDAGLDIAQVFEILGMAAMAAPETPDDG